MKDLKDPTGPDLWFTQHIIADGNHIVIKVNDKAIVDTIEDENTYAKGFLALQQHNLGSVVYFKNLTFRRLPVTKWRLAPRYDRERQGGSRRPGRVRALAFRFFRMAGGWFLDASSSAGCRKTGCC